MTTKAMDVIAFARDVFDAQMVEEPLLRADGTLWNAQVKIGDTTIMLGDPRDPAQDFPVFVHVYVPDCDATYRRALDAGATTVMAPEDQFYGDRAGGVRDSAGNVWWIATHMRTLPRAEIERLARQKDAGG
jgi:PhnB protein